MNSEVISLLLTLSPTLELFILGTIPGPWRLWRKDCMRRTSVSCTVVDKGTSPSGETGKPRSPVLQVLSVLISPSLSTPSPIVMHRSSGKGKDHVFPEQPPLFFLHFKFLNLVLFLDLNQQWILISCSPNSHSVLSCWMWHLLIQVKIFQKWF